MARQSYSGDITIYPDRHLMNPGKSFSNFSSAEIEIILWEGRRAAWPKIEPIRNPTQISRTFDRCLRCMSERHRYVKR